MFLLLIVGNMRNMQYNMQQYAKYANTISICRICTPHFADGTPGQGRRGGELYSTTELRPGPTRAAGFIAGWSPERE